VAGLRLEYGPATGKVKLFWGVQNAVLDVAGGTISWLVAASGVDDALCLVNDETDIAVVDTQPRPPDHAGYYYIARSANA
jgi:hypothetical protein